MSKGFLYDNGDELITREAESDVADAGKVLTVGEDGEAEWASPGKKVKKIYCPITISSKTLNIFFKESFDTNQTMKLSEVYELQSEYELLFIGRDGNIPVKYISKSGTTYSIYLTYFSHYSTAGTIAYNTNDYVQSSNDDATQISSTNANVYTLTPAT